MSVSRAALLCAFPGPPLLSPPFPYQAPDPRDEEIRRLAEEIRRQADEIRRQAVEVGSLRAAVSAAEEATCREKAAAAAAVEEATRHEKAAAATAVEEATRREKAAAAAAVEEATRREQEVAAAALDAERAKAAALQVRREESRTKGGGPAPAPPLLPTSHCRLSSRRRGLSSRPCFRRRTSTRLTATTPRRQRGRS